MPLDIYLQPEIYKTNLLIKKKEKTNSNDIYIFPNTGKLPLNPAGTS